MLSLPSPTLAVDVQPFIARAHRLRGAATADLISKLLRWMAAASR